MDYKDNQIITRLYTLAHVLDNRIADELIKINSESRQACYDGDKTKELQIAVHLLKVYALIKDGKLDEDKDYSIIILDSLNDTDKLSRLTGESV